MERLGATGFGRHGKARYGVDWLGGARFGRLGMERSGMAWWGLVGLG